MQDEGRDTSVGPGPSRSVAPPTELPVPSRVAVIDLETGGLDPSTDPILQVAVVHASIVGRFGIEITDEWCTTVRLDRPWRRYGARHIHGIRRHRLLLAPSIGSTMRRLADRCESRLIVAHNMAFDWSFILSASDRTGIPPPAGDRLCTLELSRSLDPGRTVSHRLTDIARRLGIEHEHAHDALGDARTTALVLPRLLAARDCADQDR
jgi:DNA polymerase-3 subunit epsilon